MGLHVVMVVLVRSNCRAAGGAQTTDVAVIAHTQVLATGWKWRVNSA
jgi:hypothetical protein